VYAIFRKKLTTLYIERDLLQCIFSQRLGLNRPQKGQNMNEKEQIERDEFAPLLGVVIGVLTEGHKIPLYGRLVALSPGFLTLERRDGTKVIVRRKAILTAMPCKNQGRGV
jgi:hypothetical protein